MDARRVSAWALLLTVPLSSLLGLARAMAEEDPGLFGDVWSANLWGDLVFMGGTVAAGLAVARLVRRLRPGLGGLAFAVAAPASFLLHWAVYALSWTLTGPQMFDGGSFVGVTLEGFPDAWSFTAKWGWPGLLAMAAISPALAWSRPESAERAEATPPAGTA